MKIHICTWNTKKYLQICEFLPVEITPVQVDLDVPETQTNLLTEISYDKCLQSYIELQAPVLVDDSGIYFLWYTEFPGALSKFIYKWIWLEGIVKLFDGNVDTRAKFQSVISYMDETLPEPIQFIWESAWSIDLSVREKYYNNGVDNLPYDLIFKADWMEKIVYEDYEWWKSVNHRVKAVKKFCEWYEWRG